MAKGNSIDKQWKQYTEKQTAITTNHARQEVLAYTFFVFSCDDQRRLHKLLPEHKFCGNSCCSIFCSFVGLVVFCFCSWIILLLEYHFRLVCSVFIYSLFVFRLGYSDLSSDLDTLICLQTWILWFVFRLGYSDLSSDLDTLICLQTWILWFVFRLGYSDLSSDLDTLICLQTWILWFVFRLGYSDLSSQCSTLCSSSYLVLCVNSSSELGTLCSILDLGNLRSSSDLGTFCSSSTLGSLSSSANYDSLPSSSNLVFLYSSWKLDTLCGSSDLDILLSLVRSVRLRS
jgi:hypothetical protein